ncbi:MAG: hypothetical protein ACQ9MH_02940 [Nitrospinales bacterium]
MDIIKQFRFSAFIAAGINLLAAMAMLLFLRPGLVPMEVTERISYIVANTLLWKMTWGLWILAALSLICFFIHWAWMLDQFSQKKCRGIIIFGALVGSLGMIPDTVAETLYLSIIPKLANEASQISDTQQLRLIHGEFMKFEFLASTLTGLLGNGFYCVGGLTLSLVSVNVSDFPKFWAYAGLPIWLFGFGLTIATFFNSILGLEIFTALTMISFIAWSGLLSLFIHIKKSF